MPQDGGSVYIRNPDSFLTTQRYNTEDRILHSYRCENLKFNVTQPGNCSKISDITFMLTNGPL
jgi:hypothetical protein